MAVVRQRPLSASRRPRSASRRLRSASQRPRSASLPLPTASFASPTLYSSGGRIYLESTTFSDTALSASDSAVVSVKGCDFVNSQLFVHNNCQVEMIKSTFKLQTHHQPRVVVLPLASIAPHCLVKVRKGSTASVSNCRFFAARPVSVERVALDENEGVISSKCQSGNDVRETSLRCIRGYVRPLVCRSVRPSRVFF